MKKIFTGFPINSRDGIIVIEGNDFHHMANVLRVKTGEKFVAGDPEGNEFIAVIKVIDRKNIILDIIEKYDRKPPGTPEMDLYFAVLKSDKNESVIRYCTEIGVDRFHPVICDNCIVKPDRASAVKKQNKWETIAREASMQCGRKKIPEIFPIVGFDNINKYDIDSLSLKMFGNIDADSQSLSSVLETNRVLKKTDIFIGPEGDFSDRETGILRGNGWTGINLGQNILRSETASVFIASSIVFYFQEGNK